MRLIASSALLLVGGLGLGLYGAMSPSRVQPPAPSTRLAGPDRTVGPVVAPAIPLAAGPAGAATTSARVDSAPASIAIPALGISSSLGPARGLTSQGVIDDAPLSGPTWSLPWWYDAGPAPGEVGSAVILGHVDSAAGAGHLGAFFPLGNARSGDLITVTLMDGSATSWVVTSARLYSDSQFPNAVVYGRSGPPTLRLVTCGGPFDYQTHLYQSALVVTARPSSGA